MSSGGRLRIGASASDCCVSRASALHAAIHARLVAPVDLEGMLSCLAVARARSEEGVLASSGQFPGTLQYWRAQHARPQRRILILRLT